MRALCIGDSQLGVTTVTLESQEAVWNQAVDIAIDRQVDAVLHGGDLMEGPLVAPEHLLAFRRPLARLRDAGIPMLLIRGNHDGAARPVDALDVFHEYDLLTVSQRPGNYVLGDCAISTLPWTKRGRDGQNTPAQLVAIARELHDQAPASLPNVLLVHWSISGSSLPTGLPVDQLHEPVLEWAELDALGFDCVIASHIHKAQRLDKPELGDATMGFYTGSPQPLNHGEAGYEHGVWLVDVEPGAVSLDFVPIDAPNFVTLDYDLNGVMISDVREGDIVRVRYTATREEDAAVDKATIRRELLAAGASRVTIEPQITREVRARVETLTQELDPLEALWQYTEAQEIAETMRELMRYRLNSWIGS